jgi:hypothetical protein
MAALKSVKAQSGVFELILLFGVGTMIFAVCVLSLNNYRTSYTNMGNEDMLAQVGDQVAYAIVKASESFSDEARYTIPIPEKIGDEQYTISLTQADGLKVTLTTSGKNRVSGLYGIFDSTNSPYSMNIGPSSVESSNGKVVVSRNPGKIIKLE